MLRERQCRRQRVGGGGRRLKLFEQGDTCPARLSDGIARHLELRRVCSLALVEAQPRDRLGVTAEVGAGVRVRVRVRVGLILTLALTWM